MLDYLKKMFRKKECVQISNEEKFENLYYLFKKKLKNEKSIFAYVSEFKFFLKILKYCVILIH